MLVFTRANLARFKTVATELEKIYNYKSITHVGITGLGELAFAGKNVYDEILVIVCSQLDVTEWTFDARPLSGEEWTIEPDLIAAWIIKGSLDSDSFTVKTSTTLF